MTMTGNWLSQHFYTDAGHMAETDVHCTGVSRFFFEKSKCLKKKEEKINRARQANLQLKAAACGSPTKSPMPSGCGCIFDRGM